MTPLFEARHLRKRFGDVEALDDVTLAIPRGSVVGLIGPNGSGKTTLLHHVTGLYLPTSGECETFGTPSPKLGDEELSRLGVVQQNGRFLEWMTVRQQLDYVSSFYRTWDRELEARLLKELDLTPSARVVNLSPGNTQKLSLILATGHRPELLLLDEPVSALDPLAREKLFRFLLDLLVDEKLTIVISSHVLRDIERLVDRVVCLKQGRLQRDANYDDLQERYSGWLVTGERELPARFEEPYVLSQEIAGRQGRLIVCAGDASGFSSKHQVRVESKPLNLEQMYPYLLGEEGR